MEFNEKIVMGEAPADTSTYKDGKPGKKIGQIEEEQGSFSFLNAVKELSLNE